jgi:hypothetical protein
MAAYWHAILSAASPTYTENIYLGAGTGVIIHDNLIILTGNFAIGIEIETSSDGMDIHQTTFSIIQAPAPMASTSTLR